MRRILLYHTGALGDFLTLLPGLRLLRRVRPGAHLALLGKPLYGELARAYGLLDTVEDATSARYAALYGPEAQAAARQHLRDHDLALLFTASPGLTAAVRAAVPVVHAQPPRPPPHVWTYSHVLGFVAAALGLDPEAAVCRDCLLPPLLPAASTEANAGDARNPGYPPPDGGVIWLHPGSASPAKCWPAHHFARLARLLREAGLKLVWSFGPADTVLASEQSLGMAKEDGLSMDDPPRTLARRLQSAAVYVGADTGVTHLAAAVGCPAVVLFGPTDDRVWRPPGQGGLRVLTRRSVCAAAPGPLCGKDLPPRCARVRSGSAACLSAIPAEDVLNAVLELAGHVVAG